MIEPRTSMQNITICEVGIFNDENYLLVELKDKNFAKPSYLCIAQN